jgi:hypothetical protein
MKLKIASLGLYAFLTACSVQVPANVQALIETQVPMKMKPGVWELMAEEYGEDVLKSQPSAELPYELRKLCITAAVSREDLEWLIILETSLPGDFKRKDCQPNVSRNGEQTAFEMICKADTLAAVTKGEIVFAPKQITTQVEMTLTVFGIIKQATRIRELQIKFHDNDCGGLGPLDKIIKEYSPAQGWGKN